MRIIVLLMDIILYSNLATCQTQGVYTTKTENPSIDCGLYLYNENVYELILEEQEMDDNVMNVLVSYGTYTLKDNQLSLYDKFNGFKMLFEYKNGIMKAKKTFSWLMNKQFSKSNFQIWDEPSFLKGKITPLNKDLLDIEQKNKDLFCLEIGMYENKQGFSINFQPNNKYVLDYKRIALSSGAWKRDGNVVALYDTYLKNYFYIIITKEGLINKFLPGEYKGRLLTKKRSIP